MKRSAWIAAVFGIAAATGLLVVPSAEARGTAAEKSHASSDAGPVDPGGPDAAPDPCGGKPCPMREWMRAHATPAVLAPDYDALSAALETIATFGPDAKAYPNWVSIAKDGADAARAGELDAVKAACRGCHQQYREKYIHELRERPLP